MSGMRAEVAFKGRWGFAVYSNFTDDPAGERKIADTWEDDGFKLLTDPNSEWQRDEVQKIADETMADAQKLFDILDRIEKADP